MYSILASRFKTVQGMRSDKPLSNDQIMSVAPSILAEEAHDSRSARYAYIPTIKVLDRLRTEGFQPFMVCQTRVRDEGRREHTKHMVRLRHASQINAAEANEIILLNSHDGSSSYQMIGGMYRFVCANGMVCGDTMNDVRIPHKGNVIERVIEGAYTVLDDFGTAVEERDNMKSLALTRAQQEVFAQGVLAYRFADQATVPVTESQILMPRRNEDRADDMWSTLNRVQENVIRGGLKGRNARGRTQTTREVTGIDQNVKLNRALWVMAEAMRKLVG